MDEVATDPRFGLRVKSRGWDGQCVSSLALTPRVSSRVNFETTFEEVYPGLFRYCHRLTGDTDLSEDVVQEAFVRLYEGRIEGTDEGLRAWLFRTATHLVRDRYRVGENRRRLLEAYPVHPGDSRPTDEAVLRKEEVARVRQALEHLGEREQEILLMRHAGFSYREIAEAVDVSPTSVGTLLARAERNFVSVYAPPRENDDAPR
jgi:RNA polymerase sigma-70 factor (ECF subfamily)